MPTTIKICTWNIELGKQIDQILNEVKNNPDFKNVDIFALQEASVNDNQQDAKQIAKVLGNTYKYFQINYEKVFGRVQANGIIWNSEKITVKVKTQRHLPNFYEEKVPSFEEFLLSKILFFQKRNFVVISGNMNYSEAKLPEYPRHSAYGKFVSNHSPSQQAARYSGSKIKSISFKFYVTHLDLLGFKHRFNQLNFILKDTTKNDSSLCFIAGDFNTIKIFGRPRWKKLSDAIKSYKFKNVTTNLKITHNLFLPQKLDHILVRSKKEFKHKSWMLKTKGSDHYPVFAEIMV